MLVPKIEEIRQRRLKAGLSMWKLSLMAGLPQNALLRIEKGKTSYTHPIRARAIAKALQCGVEDIFTETKGA